MKPHPSRTANQNRSRRSCLPELPSIRAGWQRALTSSAGIQTIPVASLPQRSVPGSALTPVNHPVPDGWNRKLAHLAPTLRYFHLPCPLRSICPLHQLLTKLVEKCLPTPCLHGFQRHPVNARSSVICPGLQIGFAQSLSFTDVHIQTPKAPRRFSLRLDV